MIGYDCKNKERGCTAKVIKSKDDGKYHEVVNGQIAERHLCKFWPSKADGKTPQDVLNQQKQLMSNDQAKEASQQYNKQWPKNEEYEKKIESALSMMMEYIFNIELKLSDIIRLAKGEDIEVLLGQKDDQIAKYKEIERERSFSTAKGDKA